MTISDLGPDVHVRTRTHTGRENGDLGGAGPEDPRARVRYHENPDVHGSDTPGSSVEIFDHSALISPADRKSAGHLGDAWLAGAESYLATTPPATVGAAWRGVNGDSSEDRGRGLAVPLLWLAGLLRALIITGLYAVALAAATRRRTAGVAVAAAVLVAVYFTCRALLP